MIAAGDRVQWGGSFHDPYRRGWPREHGQGAPGSRHPQRYPPLPQEGRSNGVAHPGKERKRP